MTAKRTALLTAAIVSTLAGLYCLLWAWASANLAFVPCDGHFSWTAESYRCRQPHIALSLTFLLLMVGVLLVRLSRKS